MEKKLDFTLKWSLGLFVFALVAFLVTGVFLEGALAAASLSIQRILTTVLITLPTSIGAILGVVSLLRPPRRLLLSILAIVLNGLSAVFFAFLAAFSG